MRHRYDDRLTERGPTARAAFASRLVVDSSLRHMGGSRQHAIAFLGAQTTLAPIDVENQIGRYIAMPGQALAYVVGCLHIRALRAHAEAALGEGFDLRTFHDALLAGGALPLDVLDGEVARHLGISTPAELGSAAAPVPLSESGWES